MGLGEYHTSRSYAEFSNCQRGNCNEVKNFPRQVYEEVNQSFSLFCEHIVRGTGSARVIILPLFVLLAHW